MSRRWRTGIHPSLKFLNFIALIYLIVCEDWDKIMRQKVPKSVHSFFKGTRKKSEISSSLPVTEPKRCAEASVSCALHCTQIILARLLGHTESLCLCVVGCKSAIKWTWENKCLENQFTPECLRVLGFLGFLLFVWLVCLCVRVCVKQVSPYPSIRYGIEFCYDDFLCDEFLSLSRGL